MEKLINCNIIIDIESIEMVSGANQYFEMVFLTSEKTKYKIIFDFVWDLRYSIENGYIDRASKFLHEEREKSSVLMIENSEYVKYFEGQVSGTRPTAGIRDYILFDSVDTVVEVLTIKEPVLIKI
ncbi:MAG TPA: hypothetical protein PKN87_10520 [Syntrophomonadaceae bacterium]|nr:hypothetical protein [Syntrophomonadaceae bacterium]HNX29824.1 hypothetical protein [Syntrophomonadaceae bacterium]HPR94482.1 hypothetical protein [Syntrophomonadaceae bacterium]